MSYLTLDEVSIPDNLNIFVLEDTPIFQKKFKADLVELGFKGKITIAGTVKDALVGVFIQKPDLILSDWNLPDGKGIEFLKDIRSSELFSNTPFVMVTTVDEIDFILEAVEFGVDGYIVKPWNSKEMAEKIAFAYKKRNP